MVLEAEAAALEVADLQDVSNGRIPLFPYYLTYLKNKFKIKLVFMIMVIPAKAGIQE